MIEAHHVAEVGLLVGVTAASLYPRHDVHDRSFFGGDFSKPFRKSLFCIMILEVFRVLCLDDKARITGDEMQNMSSGEHVSFMIYWLTSAIESFGISFLTLLMPYMLQCNLRDRININPNANLSPWVVAIFLFNLVGALGRAFVSPRLWAIKRIGDCLSFFPVVRTIRLHHRITQQQNVVATNPMVAMQTIVALEYFAFTVSILSTISYAIRRDDEEDLLAGFRLLGFFSNKMRLLFHGVLLNMADESMHQLPVYHASGSEPDNTEREAGLSVNLVLSRRS